MSTPKKTNKNRYRRPKAAVVTPEIVEKVEQATVIVTDAPANSLPSIVESAASPVNPEDKLKGLNDFVSKSKLRQESFAERMQWWYKDLDDQWKRIAVQFLALVMIALVVWAMREGVLKVASLSEGIEVVTSAIAIVMMMMGVQAQTQVLRMPVGKNTKE